MIENVTDQVNTYGLLCIVYQDTKKSRSDLCPKKNLFLLGMGSTEYTAGRDLMEKLTYIKNRSDGGNMTVENFGFLLAKMQKNNYIQVQMTKNRGKYFCGIELLKGVTL